MKSKRPKLTAVAYIQDFTCWGLSACLQSPGICSAPLAAAALMLPQAPLLPQRKVYWVSQASEVMQCIEDTQKNSIWSSLTWFFNGFALCSHRKGWVQLWLTEVGQQSVEPCIPGCAHSLPQLRFCSIFCDTKCLNQWMCTSECLRTCLMGRWGACHSLKDRTVCGVGQFGSPHIRKIKISRPKSLTPLFYYDAFGLWLLPQLLSCCRVVGEDWWKSASPILPKKKNPAAIGEWARLEQFASVTAAVAEL